MVRGAGYIVHRPAYPTLMKATHSHLLSSDGRTCVRATRSYDEKADVFSFAMLTWEVLHVEMPFSGSNGMQAMMQIHRNQRPHVRLPAPLARYEGLISRCWMQQPEQRPSMAEVVRTVATMGAAEACA